MAHVELTATAIEDLTALIVTHSLPEDTRQRVRRSLEPLQQFPRLGPEFSGRWRGLRFLLGPWRWLLLVYWYDESADRVIVVTVQEARSSRAAIRA